MKSHEPSNDFLVAAIDLQNFSMINNELSHEAGNKALESFAIAIEKKIGDYLDIFRVGGDEFLAMGNVGKRKVKPLLQKIARITIVQEPVDDEKKESVTTFARIGAVYGNMPLNEARHKADKLERKVKSNLGTKRGKLLMKPPIGNLILYQFVETGKIYNGDGLLTMVV